MQGAHMRLSFLTLLVLQLLEPVLGRVKPKKGTFRVNIHNFTPQNTQGNRSRRHVFREDLFDNNPAVYGIVKVGYPVQTFRVIFDTGSHDFWLATKGCHVGFTNTTPCSKKTLYDPDASTTFFPHSQTFFLQYEGGYVGGKYGSDTVRVGDVGQFWVDNMIVGLGTRMDVDVNNMPLDGIMGLSPVTDYPASFMSRAWELGLLQEPVFTVFRDVPVGFRKNRHPIQTPPVEAQQNGSILFGGLDTDNCNANVTYVPINVDHKWLFTAERVSLEFSNKTELVVARNFQVRSDTGSTYIYAPFRQFCKILAALNFHGKCNRVYTYIYGTRFDCLTNFTLNLQISGRNFTLTEEDLFEESELGGCQLRISHSDDNLWVLGDVFIQKYCHVYDFGQKRIGFADHLDENDRKSEPRPDYGRYKAKGPVFDLDTMLHRIGSEAWLGSRIEHLQNQTDYIEKRLNEDNWDFARFARKRVNKYWAWNELPQTIKKGNRLLGEYLKLVDETLPLLRRIKEEGQKAAHSFYPEKYSNVPN